MWCSEGRVCCPHFVSSEPLPVCTAHISDYKESPETGVVFDIESPAGNVFSRVNISYTEGQQARAMLYKGPELLWGSVSTQAMVSSHQDHEKSGLFFHTSGASPQNSWRSWDTFKHVLVGRYVLMLKNLFKQLQCGLESHRSWTHHILLNWSSKC